MCQHAERVAQDLCMKDFFGLLLLERRHSGDAAGGRCWWWVWVFGARGTERRGRRATLQVLQVQSVVQGHEVRMTRYPPERHIVLGKQKERVFEGEEKWKRKKTKPPVNTLLGKTITPSTWVSKHPQWPITSHETFEGERFPKQNHRKHWDHLEFNKKQGFKPDKNLDFCTFIRLMHLPNYFIKLRFYKEAKVQQTKKILSSFTHPLHSKNDF